MENKRKKYIVIACIILLLPYVLTVFLGGKDVFLKDEEVVYVNVVIDGDICSVAWDKFLLGVVAKEIPSDYSDEAIKAQIVIARTRLLLEAEEEADYIYTDTFYTLEGIQSKWGKVEGYEVYTFLEELILETEGEVLYYGEELATTPYHMLNNGMTRKGSEVLLGDYPYLVSKECPLDVEAEKEITMMTLTFDELKMQLNDDLSLELEDLVFEDFEILSVDEASYVLSIAIQDYIIDGETFRNILGLKSSSFTFEKEESAIRITTQGIGHGLGLSQNTAHYMGLEGKCYIEILQYFYGGTELVSYDKS